MKLNKIPIIIAVGMLMLAIGPLPSSYYTLLRIVICGVAVYATITISEDNRKSWKWGCAFAGIALLFNPFIPAQLNRGLWSFADIVAAFIFGTLLLKDSGVPAKAKRSIEVNNDENRHAIRRDRRRLIIFVILQFACAVSFFLLGFVVARFPRYLDRELMLGFIAGIIINIIVLLYTTVCVYKILRWAHPKKGIAILISVLYGIVTLIFFPLIVVLGTGLILWSRKLGAGEEKSS